jgi:hypothetical protein
MTDDPRAVYEALHRSTAEMFGYSGDLTLTQGLQVDLASVLRLEIDALQGQRLAGQAIDLARLSTAFLMLQKLLPQSVAAPQLRESHHARDRLLQIVNDIAEVQAEDEADEVARLSQLVAEKDAVIAALGGAIAQPAASPPPPAPAPPASPPEQTTKSNQPPLPPANAAFPRAYLRDDSAPWRSHVEGGRDRWRNNNV